MHFESIENIMFVLFNIFYEFLSYSDPEKYLCFPFLPDNKTSLSESDSAWQQDGSPQWSRVIPADSVCLSDDGTDRPHHCSCTSHCYSRNILRLVWPRIKYWYGRCVLYCFTNIIFKTNPNNLSPVSRWGAGELEGGRADMSNCNKIVTSCLL